MKITIEWRYNNTTIFKDSSLSYITEIICLKLAL